MLHCSQFVILKTIEKLINIIGLVQLDCKLCLINLDLITKTNPNRTSLDLEALLELFLEVLIHSLVIGEMQKIVSINSMNYKAMLS